MDPSYKLELKFVERWKRHGVDERIATAVFARLFQAYTHSERGYHDIHHILDLDREFDCWKALVEDADAVWDALIWHDAWYIARPDYTKNEEKSFEMMREDTRKFRLSDVHVEKVGRIIVRGTKHLGGLIDRDEQFMADMDLAALGYTWPHTLAASRKIRYEWRRIPQPDYISGRRQVLQMFLDRGKDLYYMTSFRHEYGERALANLSCEIEELPKLVKRFDNGE